MYATDRQTDRRQTWERRQTKTSLKCLRPMGRRHNKLTTTLQLQMIDYYQQHWW